jgi:hypothetical protein
MTIEVKDGEDSSKVSVQCSIDRIVDLILGSKLSKNVDRSRELAAMIGKKQ